MRRRVVIVSRLLLWSVGLVVASNTPATELENYSGTITNLHQSVIPLRVPTSQLIGGHRRHHRENCSATVIRSKPLTLLSAWHCFDGADDLSRPPEIFVNGQWLTARLVATGGSMQADWAILTAQPFNGDKRDDLLPLPVLTGNESSAAAVINVAGYPNRRYEQSALWVSDRCPLTGTTHQWIGAACVAAKGVSGGPALMETDAGWFVIGVVSAQRHDDTLLIAPLPAAARSYWPTTTQLEGPREDVR